MSNPFPSLKAAAMLRVLTRELGYQVAREAGGSHRRLVAEGRPPLTFAFHQGATLPPGVVRDILMKQVGLDRQTALKVVRGER